MKFGILILLASSSLFAEQYCNSERLNRDIKKANSADLSPEERIATMKSAFEEMVEVNKNPKGNMPKSYYVNCYKKNEDLFTLLYDNAPPQAKLRSEFKELVGDFFVFRGNSADALVFYDQCAKMDPQNLSVRLKAFQIYVSLESARLSKLSDNDRQSLLPNFRQEAFRRIDEVIQQPTGNKTIRIGALLAKSQLQLTESNWNAAIKLLNKVLELDPQNENALYISSKVLVEKKLYSQAIPKLEKLTHIQTYKLWAYKSLAQIYFEEKKAQELNSLADKALKDLPAEYAFKLYKAYSLIWNQRNQEALTLYKSLNKLDHPLYKGFAAELYENLGDQAISENKLAIAIPFYKKAILETEHSKKVRTKVSLALLNFARSKSFTPSNTVAQDMDYALETILPVLNEEALEETLLLDMIEIAQHSNQQQKISLICDRYLGEYKNITSDTHALVCAKAYAMENKKDKARQILSKHLKSQSRDPSQNEIFLELKKLGI
jgi:hypothetical protein